MSGLVSERTIQEKLTSDAQAIEGAKHRQRLAIGQDGDVTWDFSRNDS